MTSVAAYNYRGHTVAFTGTRNGHMRKVGILCLFVSVCAVETEKSESAGNTVQSNLFSLSLTAGCSYLCEWGLSECANRHSVDPRHIFLFAAFCKVN